MKKLIIILGILALGAIGYWFVALRTPPAFIVDSRDTLSTWDFAGSHKDGGVLESQVRDEIGRLEERLRDADTEPPDYQLYVGLANQYTLLGDGKRAFDELEHALSIDSDKTGLALHNMGVLMEKLGALNSARTAFERAVDVQPHIDSYHIAYIEFLLKHFSDDSDAINAAFARAESQFDDTTFVLQQRAAWYTQTGRFQDAIDIWQKLRETAPAELVPDIEKEIDKLRTRL